MMNDRDGCQDPYSIQSNEFILDESNEANRTFATMTGSKVVHDFQNFLPPSEQISDDTNNNTSINRNSSTTARYRSDIKNHRPSPVAQAFFAALDIAEQQQQEEQGPEVPIKKKTTFQKSQLIQKQIQTLGWRNRYSQHDLYPLTIVTTTSPMTSIPASTSSFSASSDSSLTTTGTTSTTQSTTFHVRQVQRGEIDETYGTGATVWPASVVLIKYLQRHATQFFPNHCGRVVLDLGTGTGITSIAAALLGAKHIICTDGDANVVQLAKSNIIRAAKEILNCGTNNNNDDDDGCKEPTIPIGASRDMTEKHDLIVNGTVTAVSTAVEREQSPIQHTDGDDDVVLINNCSIEVQQYWWGTGTIHSRMIKDNQSITCTTDTNNIENISSSSNTIVGGFDMILVSDCVLPKLYPIEPLIDAIHQMLGQRRSDPTPVAIVAYEYRYYDQYDPKQYVLELCAQKQLELMVVPATEHDPIYSIPDDIEIWHICRIMG